MNAAVSSDEENEHVPEFVNIKSALNRKRREFYPPIPWRIRDVDIRGAWSKTWNNKTFMFFQSTRWGLALFMTARNARRLSDCSELHIDGTFKCCPKPYHQLVTVHGRYHDRVIPLAFGLLKSKEVALYRKMLSKIKERVLEVSGSHLDPRILLTDFEISLMSAIEAEFPQATVKGCFFHFTQSIWRRVLELGLARPYKHDRKLSNFVRKLMAMAYIPTALVRQNFQLIHGCRSIRRLVQRYPAVRDLIRYFNRNYITGQFPPPVWNVMHRDSTSRTNNHVEG
jgi:hypothetical protein